MERERVENFHFNNFSFWQKKSHSSAASMIPLKYDNGTNEDIKRMVRRGRNGWKRANSAFWVRSLAATVRCLPAFAVCGLCFAGKFRWIFHCLLSRRREGKARRRSSSKPKWLWERWQSLCDLCLFSCRIILLSFFLASCWASSFSNFLSRCCCCELFYLNPWDVRALQACLTLFMEILLLFEFMFLQ